MIQFSVLFSLLVISSTSWASTIQEYEDKEPYYYLTESYDNIDDLSIQYADWNPTDTQEIWRWNVEDFPHPILTPRFCGRYAPSTICNPDFILSSEEAKSLDVAIRAVYNETPCICENCDPSIGGIKIGIAILKNTYRPYNEMPSKIIRSFAMNLRSKWRLGECNDDILVVVATEDRQSYTDVGDATSSFISQEEAYRIFLENKALFSESRYYDGLRAMLIAYQKATENITRDKPKPKVNVARLVGIVIGALLVVAIIGLVAIFIYKKCRKRKNSNSPSLDSGSDTLSSTWKRRILPSDIIPKFDFHKQSKSEEGTLPVRDVEQTLLKNTEKPDFEDTQITLVEDKEETVPLNAGDSNVPTESSEYSIEIPRNEIEEPARTLQTFAPKKPTETDL